MFLEPFGELLPGILVAGEFLGQAQGKIESVSVAYNLCFYLTGSYYFFPGDIGFVVGFFNFGRDALFFTLGFPVEGYQVLLCSRIIISDLPEFL
jgi:hypothetical protein